MIINRIRLDGLIYSLESFLHLNMCRELQIFAFLYMYSDASYVSLDFVLVNLDLLQSMILLSGSLELHFASTYYYYYYYYYYVIVGLSKSNLFCLTTTRLL